MHNGILILDLVITLLDVLVSKYLHPRLPISQHEQIEKCYHPVGVIIEVEEQVAKFVKGIIGELINWKTTTVLNDNWR